MFDSSEDGWYRVAFNDIGRLRGAADLFFGIVHLDVREDGNSHWGGPSSLLSKLGGCEIGASVKTHPAKKDIQHPPERLPSEPDGHGWGGWDVPRWMDDFAFQP